MTAPPPQGPSTSAADRPAAAQDGPADQAGQQGLAGAGSPTMVDRLFRRQGQQRPRLGWRRAVLVAAAVLVVLSLVRVVVDLLGGDASRLTSPGTVATALALAVPIGLAALGGLWAERAGVVNIGLEGMLILGTWFGAYVGYQAGPWWGVLAGLLGGALGGLLHAVATVTFGVDHIVSGVAVNILAGAGTGGVTRYLSGIAYDDVEGGSITQSPPLDPIAEVSVPLVSDAARELARTDVPLLRDAAGVVAGVTTDVSLLTLVAVALVPLTWFLLWRTPLGLQIRACGENPVAADSLGVHVYRLKYLAVVVSGALAGLGGAFLVTVASNIYREGQTRGQGFIGLAAMIFGNWRPTGAASGALLFGYADGLRLRDNQGGAVAALLLVVAVGLLALAVRAVLQARRRSAALLAAGSVALVGLYLGLDEVPTQLLGATPYLVTLVVLAVAAQRLRMPAADGMRYRRGQQ